VFGRLKKKATGEDGTNAPGGAPAPETEAGLTEVEKARRDVMLACLEAMKQSQRGGEKHPAAAGGNGKTHLIQPLSAKSVVAEPPHASASPMTKPPMAPKPAPAAVIPSVASPILEAQNLAASRVSPAQVSTEERRATGELKIAIQTGEDIAEEQEEAAVPPRPDNRHKLPICAADDFLEDVLMGIVAEDIATYRTQWGRDGQ
jgi:hypothetical protein